MSDLDEALSVLTQPHKTARDTRVAAAESPLRVAVVGCGKIAQELHLPILAGHEQVKIAALVDRDVMRAQQLAAGYGVGTVLKDGATLDRDHIDAAVVATPPFHHAPASIELMRRGIHVLVEKPMATSYEDAQSMIQTADEAGVVLAVGFFRRLMPSFRMLQALVRSEWLGQPVRFNAEGGGFYDWSAATLGNMRKEYAGGGVLIDFGSHLLDLLHALFEGPGEVVDYRDNSLGGIEADCSVQLRLYHRGQAVEGAVEVARTRKLGNFVRVHCERGTLEYQFTDRYRVRVCPRDLELVDPLSSQARDFVLHAGWANESDTSWYETVRTEFDDWLGAIRSGRQPELSGKSALPTVQVIEECYRRIQPMAEPWVLAGVLRSGEQKGLGVRRQASGVSTSSSVEGRALSEQEESGSSTAQRLNGSTPQLRFASTPRALITGATGFIGCRVAEVLHRAGWQVRALVHNPGSAARLARLSVELVHADLGDSQGVGELVTGCDAVVHCAIGTEWGERRRIFDVTVTGTQRLLDAALAAGVRRFVHLSTMSVYGDDMKLSGILEEIRPMQPSPGSDYGESKAAAERAVARAVQKGLSAVVFRPARVYGPFSRIFITRPIEAIAQGRFQWLGEPDVPCDMVYVDNLVDAIVSALGAPDEAVKGEVFNIGDGDDTTWRAFYEYFAERLGLDLSNVPVTVPAERLKIGIARRVVGWPAAWYRGFRTVAQSQEFRSLGRRVLQTDPLGTLPRWILERVPAMERGVRRMVKADGSLPIYRREPSAPADIVVMGSGGAVVSIEKARSILGYGPPVPRDRAMELTLDWVKHARLV